MKSHEISTKGFDEYTFAIKIEYISPSKLKDKHAKQLTAAIDLGDVSAVPIKNLFDIRSWIRNEADRLAQEEAKIVNAAYYDAEQRRNDYFQAIAEEDYGFAHYDEKLKSMIHSFAWQERHSDGYRNVLDGYSDIISIVDEAIAIEKSKLQ